MKSFPRKLITEWRKMKLPMSDAAFVVAVSGGADSIALLAALHELSQLKKFKLNFIVAHFNHQLRGADADADEDFVKNLAQTFNFEFIVGTPKTPLVKKSNLEESARRARYDFLFDLAESKSAVAVLTAHTQDDQAETLLLRLIRGSGADGLSAISRFWILDFGFWTDEAAENDCSKSDQSKIQNLKSKIAVIRPLLAWARREDTENYCLENNLEFRVDAMNFDSRFTRVRVRRELLPLLASFNPKIIETLANTADLLRADADELNSSAAQILAQMQNSAAVEILPVNADFAALSCALRRRVLRLWLEKQRGTLRRIDTKHLRAVDDLACRSVGGRTIELPDRAFVTRQKSKLFYSKHATG